MGKVYTLPISYTQYVNFVRFLAEHVVLATRLPAPIAHAAIRGDEHPPNRMERSLETPVSGKRSILLVLLLFILFYFKFSVGISILNISQHDVRRLCRRAHYSAAGRPPAVAYSSCIRRQYRS
jgi:hypothetical protein